MKGCRLIVCLPLFLSVFVNAKECKSLFCLSFFSKQIDVNINLFDRTKPPLPIEDLIQQSGYPVERHTIITEDNYILTYHRIPHGKEGGGALRIGRPPVLVQHGLLGASSSWVLSNQSLGFSLADAGFDVWLGNSRGNTYSRNHTKYDPDEDKKGFWNFSWHEMGYYDLPAGIEYILNTTAHHQLSYIGHSMGTTMFFGLGAARPAYMDKVRAAVLLAPVAFPWNIISPIAKYMTDFHSILKLIMQTFNIYEVFPYSNSTLWIDQHICSKQHYQAICRDVLFYIGGFNEKELKLPLLVKILEYMPAGTSFKTLRHLRQITERGSKFQQFDYGYIYNKWHYGSFNPPAYNLSNVKAPTYAYYASNDWLAVPEDVWHAVELLPNVKDVKRVPDDNFNHLDYMWGSNAKALLYDDIIATLRGITNNDDPNTY